MTRGNKRQKHYARLCVAAHKVYIITKSIIVDDPG
jgi:hypothetical protein